MIMKMLPMQVAAEVVAGLRMAIVYYPAKLMDAFVLIDFDFLRVCCRLCSCALHAQGKETNEVRRLYVNFFITKLYTSKDLVCLLYRLYNTSILLNVSQA